MHTAVSEISLFIQGILLTRISISWIRSHSRSSTSSNDWAKVALDKTGRTRRRSDWLARPIGIALLPTYAEDEWFRHRKYHSVQVAFFRGFLGASGRSVFCMGLISTSQMLP